MLSRALNSLFYYMTILAPSAVNCSPRKEEHWMLYLQRKQLLSSTFIEQCTKVVNNKPQLYFSELLFPISFKDDPEQYSFVSEEKTNLFHGKGQIHKLFDNYCWGKMLHVSLDTRTPDELTQEIGHQFTDLSWNP